MIQAGIQGKITPIPYCYLEQGKDTGASSNLPREVSITLEPKPPER